MMPVNYLLSTYSDIGAPTTAVIFIHTHVIVLLRITLISIAFDSRT